MCHSTLQQCHSDTVFTRGKNLAVVGVRFIEPESKGGAMKKKPMCVLIVDDDPTLRSVLQALLEVKGYEIIEAGDGEEGLRQVQRKHPNIIILDGMMPKKSGFELAYELKNLPQYEKIPIIMLTGVDKASAKTESYWRSKSRADVYMAKPFDYVKLVDTVEKLLNENYREEGDGLTRYRV